MKNWFLSLSLTIARVTLVGLIVCTPSSAATGSVVSIDVPAANSTAVQPFSIGGWAIDPAATANTGVDAIHVYAYPNPGSGAPPIFVTASTGSTYGAERPDLAAAYGPQFRYCGYNLTVSGLAPNTYLLLVYAHSAIDGQWGNSSVVLNVQAQPAMSLDVPTPGSDLPSSFTVSGWAIDVASASGTGVSTIDVWAAPVEGGSSLWVGEVVSGSGYGVARPDVGAAFGDSRFTPSGFNLASAALPAGRYHVVAYALSTVSNTFSLWQIATVRVGIVAPVITPAGGSFAATQTVSMTVPAGTQVRFTRNGTTPSSASELYTGPIAVTENTSLRAAAFEAGYPMTAVSSADFNFVTTAPTVTPVGATYSSPITVAVQVPPASEVHFTRDGSTPLITSEIYAGAFTVSSNTLLRARAFKPGWTPSAIASADYAFQVTAPTIVTAAGAYADPVIVLIDVPSGSAVRFTRDGSTPTESSELYSGGGFQILVNTSLRARAFRSGWAPSATVSAEYTIALATPTIQPAGGLYTAPVTVQLAASAGADLRFTRDGSTPTASSEAYSGSFQVAADTFLRVRAFKAGMTPSPVAASDYTFAAGAPAFSLPPGSYTGAISVTLSSPTPSAVVHWTDDGSDPTTASILYTGAINVAAGTSKTIKARAFRSGWTSSAVVTGTYTSLVTGPVTITARLSPAPNSAGWNNSDVTVIFDCGNATVCPDPVTIAAEGSGQVVSGTASNSDHQMSTSVTVNLDKTPPVISVDGPANGATLTQLTADVTGSTTDLGSGILQVQCNGVDAGIGTGQVSCAVALRPGRNSVVLQATDLAGNSSSSGRRVTAVIAPSSLSITPSTRTLLLNQTTRLSAVDSRGNDVAGATWTSSDPSVVTVSAEGVVTPVGVGAATVTADAAGLSATAAVTVAGGASVSPGTLLWTANTLAGTGAQIIRPWRVDADIPDFIAVVGNDVRGFLHDGSSVGLEGPPTALGVGLTQVTPDVFGGVLAISSDRQSIIRFGGTATDMPWQYRSAGVLGRLSVSPMRDIYIDETVGRRVFVLVIDGANGRVRHRYALPYSSRTFVCPNDPADAGRDESAGSFQAPVVDYDGVFHALVYSIDRTFTSEFCAEGGFTTTGLARLDALEVTAEGLSATTIWSTTDVANLPPIAYAVGLPDVRGGVLFAWDDEAGVAGAHVAGGQVSPLRLPAFPISAADEGTALAYSDTGLIAFDMASAAVVHQYGTEESLVAPLRDGKVAIHDGVGTMKVLEPGGTVSETSAMPPAVGNTGLSYSYWTLSQWMLVTDTGEVGMAAGPMVVESDGFFTLEAQGVPGRGGNVGTIAKIVHFVPSTIDVLSLSTEELYTVQMYAAAARSLRGDNTVYIHDGASLTSFLTELKSDRDAFAFIGHSVSWTSPPGDGQAVGLQFFDSSVIKADRTDTVDIRDNNQPIPAHSYYVSAMKTQAKILFIASCQLGDQFKAWWNINQDTRDQALVVPRDVGPTGLNAGAHVWLMIQEQMLSGHVSLKTAVAFANSASPVKFKVIGGDDGARIFLR